MLADYPKMPAIEEIGAEEYVVGLYKTHLGWDGISELDPKKIILNPTQWEDIAGEFRQSPEGLSAAFFWMNYGPSADESVPYGKIEIQDGAFEKATPELDTFYFSFGSSEQFPFQMGWVEVQAESREQAVALFRSHHPDKNPGIINCAFVYTEDQWRQTPMAQGGPGQVCHQVIKEQGPFSLDSHESPSKDTMKPLDELMADAKNRAAEKPSKPHDLDR